MTRNNRGAALILEQAFIMIFGIVIILMVITVFSKVRDDTATSIATIELEGVGMYVRNAVTHAYMSGQDSSTGSIELQLPETVAGKTYKVTLNNTHVNAELLFGTLNRAQPLYNFNTTLSGTISSTGGKKKYVTYDAASGNITLETLS